MIDSEGRVELAVLRSLGGEPSLDRMTVAGHDGVDSLLSDPSVIAVERADRQLVRHLDESAVIVGADVSYQDGASGYGVTVAIIDSGVESDHPDLVDSVVYEACFVELPDGTGLCPGGLTEVFGAGSAPDDLYGHGTAVAGVIASSGQVAPLGIAPHAHIEMYKIFDGDSGGYYFDMLLALRHILLFRPDVDIINLSLGYPEFFVGECDSEYPILEELVADLRAENRIVIASTGNEGRATMGAPACMSGVISVAATGDDARSVAIGEVTSFSNVSSATDLAAPGDYVVTSHIDGGSFEAFGTSFAAPTVAGCAALLFQEGYRTTAQLEDRLLIGPTAENPSGPALPIVKCAVGTPPTGDVNCDGSMNVVDALVIAQHSVGARTPVYGCPLENPALQVRPAVGDLNGSQSVNILDALLVARCSAGAESPWCPLPQIPEAD